eukprot:gene10623-11773_t
MGHGSSVPIYPRQGGGLYDESRSFINIKSRKSHVDYTSDNSSMSIYTGGQFSNDCFHNLYVMDGILGKGASAPVYEVHHRATWARYACKVNPSTCSVLVKH